MRPFTLFLALATPIIAFIVPEGFPDRDCDIVRRTEKLPLVLKRRTSLSDDVITKLELEHLEKKMEEADGLGSVLENFLLSLHYHKQETQCDKKVPTDEYTADYIKAKQAFNNRCAEYKWAHFYASVSVSGNAVVYTCRKNNPSRQCSESNFGFPHKDLDKTCGNPSGGRVFAKNWDQEFGRAWRGIDLCAVDGSKDVLEIFKPTVEMEKRILGKKLRKRIIAKIAKASRSMREGRVDRLPLREGLNIRISDR